MTGPVDYNAIYGVNQQQYDQERSAAWQNVMGFYDQFMQQRAMRSGQQYGVQQQARPLVNQPPVNAGWTDEDLVGAATYWGMPEDAVRAMPRQAVIDFVNAKRQDSGRSTAVQGLAALADPKTWEANFSPFEMGAIGAGEAITGTLQKLPGIGDWMSRQKIVHEADLKLRQMEESVRSTVPGQLPSAGGGSQGVGQNMLSASNITGGAAALFYPGTAAWSIAGKVTDVMPLASRLSPIGRAAIKGGISSYLLQGGTKEGDQSPMTHRTETFAEGAAIAAGVEAVAPLVKPLVDRVLGSYRAAPTTPSAPDPGSMEIPANVQQASAPQFPQVTQLDHLKAMASNGDQQAQMMLDYMAGASGPMEIGPQGLTAFHGSNQEIDQFNTPAFFSFDQTGAESYANARAKSLGGSPVINERQINLSNPAPREVVNAVGKEMFGYDDPSGNDYLAESDPDKQNALLARLQSLGYDGAYFKDINLYTGEPIPSVVVFNADAIQKAEARAVADNKAATIIQSPNFAEIAGQTQLDDIAVARAATESNPGGVSIVQGVTDPSKFAIGPNARLAYRNGRLDLLLGENIPDYAASDYERFGVFTGQRVFTPEGVGGTVRGIDYNGTAYIEPPYTGSLITHPVDELHPWLTSPQVMEAPPLWDGFQMYADQRAAESQTAMGGGLNPRVVNTLKQKNLASWMEDFFDATGIQNPGDRSRLREYFNQRYVGSFADLAPAEMAAQQSATADLNAAMAENPLQPIQQLDQHAKTKGFVAIPKVGGGWTLQDMALSTTKQQASQISFGTREAAEEWLKQVNRDLPDITPSSEAPVEVAAVHPTAPTAPPNTNEGTGARMAEAVKDLEGQNGPPAGEPPADVHAAMDNLGALNNRFEQAQSRWVPMRRVVSATDDVVREATGGRDYGLASDYDRLSTLQNIYHTAMGPYQDELADLLAPVRTNRLVSGEWAQAYEAEGVDRVKLTQGWKPKEIESLNRYDQLMQKLFPETGLDEIRQIPQYFSHIAQRQSQPDLLPRAFEDFHLGKTTQPFYEYARTGNLNMRELDPRIVGDVYIRSVMWEKHMAPEYNALRDKWKGVVQNDPVVGPAANLMQGWLDIVKGGYHPQDDLALDTVHLALRKLVDPSITRAQAREVALNGLNNSYSGLIGFRPNMIARHTLQLFYALPRAGSDLVSTIGQFARSASARNAILDEAVADGAISPRTFTINAPGSFTGELERVGTGSERPGDVQHTARYSAIAKLQTAIRDLMPDQLKGHEDSIFKPMGAFSRAVENYRAMVYVAGKSRAARAIAAYRAGGSMDLDSLLGDSMARTFDPAWQRNFQALVSNGQDNEAAKFIGKQLSDATFFKYGVAESPAVAKSVTGRVGLQLGHYEVNYLQYLRETLQNGTAQDKAKFLATAGAVTASLEYASRKTGWNLRWLNPYIALGFGGGPWIGAAIALGSGVSHLMKAVSGEDISNLDSANQAFGQLNTAGSLLNPFSGIQQDIEGIGQGLYNSPSPGSAVARYMITGEVGPGPDINNSLMPQATQQFQQSLQHTSNPVRAGSVGLPPGQYPQQPVTDPTLLQNPLQIPAGIPANNPGLPSGYGVAPGSIETVPRIYPQFVRR